jgi:hypothetical protein
MSTNIVFANNGLWWRMMNTAQVLNTVKHQRTFKVVEREIMVLRKSNKPIGEDHYQRLMNELSVFEKQKVNPNKIKKLKAILIKLLPKSANRPTISNQNDRDVKNNSLAQEIKNEIEEIGGKKLFLSETHYARLKKELDKLTGQGEKGLDKYYTIIEKANPSAIATADQEQTKRLKEQEEAGSKICDPKDYDPVLTDDFTDNSAIIEITAPGTPTQDKDGVKGHSWVWTSRQGENKKVPIYAPIAVYLEDAGKSYDVSSSQYDYGLDLRILDNNCWRIRYHHITIDVADSIKAAIQNKKEGEKIEPVSFKAGDVLGYTSGNRPSGNWDIGLYNLNKKGPLAHISQYVQHAVCWVDYYSPEKQKFYRSKLIGPKTVCNF